MNNEKKAITRLIPDELGTVTGGYVCFNEETKMYDVIDDKTWETRISVKNPDSAKTCSTCLGNSPVIVPKSLVDSSRESLKKKQSR
jgi:hypothetical protein